MKRDRRDRGRVPATIAFGAGAGTLATGHIAPRVLTKRATALGDRVWTHFGGSDRLSARWRTVKPEQFGRLATSPVYEKYTKNLTRLRAWAESPRWKYARGAGAAALGGVGVYNLLRMWSKKRTSRQHR